MNRPSQPSSPKPSVAAATQRVLARCRRLGLALGVVSTGLLSMGAVAHADQVVVSQSWNKLPFGYCVDPNQSIASTFSPSSSGKLQSVSVWLQSDSVDRALTAQLLTANGDGSPSSTVLASTQVTAPADPGLAVHEDAASFGDGPYLTAGDTYVLALSASAQGGTCLPAWSFSNAGGADWFTDPTGPSGWQPVTDIPGLDHQAFALSVSLDTPPDKPAAPSSDQSLNSSGNQTISWTPTTDQDGDSIDHYVLQHERSDQNSFSTVANVSGTSYHFGTDGPGEAEGTWTYRVIAVDSQGTSSQPSDPSSAVVVDQTKPNAPTANTDSPAAYTDGSGNRWYRDSVTVSFTDNGDPPLADGSPGSGVASVSGPQTFNSSNVDPASGAFSASGTVTDNAGNISGPTTATGYVDWHAPSAAFSDCPSSPVLLGSGGAIHWTASDPAPSSGLATPASGSVALDTSTPGSHTLTSPAPADNVGHTGAAASCSYQVNYSFGGFGAPVQNAPSVNSGHGGRNYPLKWRLTGASGQQIAALSAIRSISYAPTSCQSFTNNPSGATAAAASGASGLRYDGSQFIFNWATPGPGCYTLFVTLDSGQSLPAYFSLS